VPELRLTPGLPACSPQQRLTEGLRRTYGGAVPETIGLPDLSSTALPKAYRRPPSGLLCTENTAPARQAYPEANRKCNPLASRRRYRRPTRALTVGPP